VRIALFILVLSLTSNLRGQFSPDGGQPGSIALHQDSVVWKGFATEVELELGWLNIADTTLGRIELNVPNAGLGAPDLDVQPLGDGGIATLTFGEPFDDQPGYDFVVFENGFATSDTTGFFELAFVEVSSNGVDYFRFPNMSLSSVADFAGPFAELDSRLLDGLAGRFSAPYGVPFDLADLAVDPRLDLGAVTHLRVIDVVGTSDSAFAKTDTDGMLIVDPYPTAYATGGFDLDAVGIIGSSVITSTEIPKANKRNKVTIAVRKGQQVPATDANSFWLNALGKAVHQGAFAPNVSGHYFVGKVDRAEAWQRCVVY